MKGLFPPSWLERLLRLCLSPRDRETILGDLLEVYREEMVPACGRWRANAWYARQVLSFLPSAMLREAPLGPALGMLCGFTVLCGLWLGSMDILFHHTNIATHELIAGSIVGQGFCTLLFLRFRKAAGLRLVVALGCLVLVWLGGMAVHGAVTSAHFEGYVLLIGLLLLVQVALTLLIFAQKARRTRQPEVL